MESPRESADPRHMSDDGDHEKMAFSEKNGATSQSSIGVSQDLNPDPDLSSSPKAADIQAACKWRDIGRLRSLAESQGGFLTDALRRQACMSGSLLFPV